MNKLARSPELKETHLEVLGILKVIERRKGLLPFGTGCDYINKFINSSKDKSVLDNDDFSVVNSTVASTAHDAASSDYGADPSDYNDG